MGQAGIEGEEVGYCNAHHNLKHYSQCPALCLILYERCAMALAGFPSRANRVRVPNDAPQTMQAHFPPLECPALSQSSRETPLATYFWSHACCLQLDMLDVHILSLPERRYSTLPRCIGSILAAIEQTPFPVAMHVIPAYLGHIGRGRSLAYSLGDYTYVTSVDDDDWIETDAFIALHAPMRNTVPAIYTREWLWQNGKRGTFDGRQNLRVFRRDVAESMDFEAWPALDSTALIAHADTFGDATYLPDRVYHYTVDPASAARKIVQEQGISA